MGMKAKRRIAMISGNYFEMTGIRLLRPCHQRLYFLYFNDHDDPGFDLLPIMIELDKYNHKNLQQFMWVLDEVGFPEVTLSWLMIRWPYIDPSGGESLKVKWLDTTFWVQKGRALKYRYAII